MSLDTDWEKIKKGLENYKWDFRTVEGLAKDSGMTIDQVKDILNSHRSEVRKTLDSHGRVLYTMGNRPKTAREFIANTQVIFTK